jgi:hypothetical protein
MYLFTRRTRLNSGAGVEWALEIGAKAAAVGGLDVQLWGKQFGDEFGTVTWSMWAPDLAALEAFGDTIAADASYQALAEKGRDHTEGGVHDALMKPLVGEPDPEAESHYVSGVSAVCAGGQIEKAMGLGAQIAEKASSITGHDTMFLQAMTGPYAAVGWLTGYPDISSMEKAQDALAGDTGWLHLVDSTGGAFAEDPSVTIQTVHRRLS